MTKRDFFFLPMDPLPKTQGGGGDWVSFHPMEGSKAWRGDAHLCGSRG